MESSHNKRMLQERRRELRKQSTPEELILWEHVRNKKLGAKFKRQYSIGYYIVDFYCPSKKLIIELDGEHHTETDTVEYDKIRDQYFKDLRYKVIRFWNSEIRDSLPEVLNRIRNFLKKTT